MTDRLSRRGVPRAWKQPFEERLAGLTTPEPNSGCLLFLGYIDPKGYGMMADHANKVRRAHRVAYEYFIGSIAPGLQLDHLCRNRACVNPTHLEPVTPYENFIRGASPGARSVRGEPCKYGHQRTQAVHRKGQPMVCFTCEQKQRRRYREANAESIREANREYSRRYRAQHSANGGETTHV